MESQIQLPVPIFFEGKTYRSVELKSHIQTSILADTNRIMEKGNQYDALRVFIAGGIEKIEDVSDRQTILSLCGHMPYKSAWIVTIKILMQDEKDDGVEGMYPCPRCGEKKICSANDDPDLDSQDYISDMKIINMPDDESNIVKYKFSTPIVISDADNHDEKIEEIEIQYPTLNNCIQAFNKIGDEDSIRLQLNIYVNALKKINGNEATRDIKSNYGMFIFEKTDRNDLRALGSILEKYGMITKVEKVCNKCKKKWFVEVNTSNFFNFAPR